MPYITAPGQPTDHPGRTYFNVNYRHEDGGNWCALVEDVRPGEQEISADDYEAMWQANQTANIKYESQREGGEDTSDWHPMPSLAAFHDHLMAQAADPQIASVTPELVASLIGFNATAGGAEIAVSAIPLVPKP